MLKYLIERLEALSDKNLKEIFDLTALAFAEDVTWLGGDWTLHTEFCNAVLRATILEGELYIITIGKGKERKIASWVSWFPPGRSLFSTQVSCTFGNLVLKFDEAPILKLVSDAQRALGYNELFKKFKPEVQDWIRNTIPQYIGKLMDEVFTEKERKLMWWCSHIATHPDFQGNGFATALINIAYQKAEKTKELGTFIGLLTQTEENVAIYNSMGLKKIGEVGNIPVPGGHTMSAYLMIRKP